MEDMHSDIYGEEDNIINFNDHKQQHICEQSVFKEYNYTMIGNNSNIENHSNKPKSYSREGDNTMDDDKILEKFLDRSDQDRRDMEQRLTEDRRESEKRIEEQRKLSEERMEKRFNEAMDSIKELSNKAEERMNRSEERIEKKYSQVLDKVQTMEDKIDRLGTETRENNKSMRNTSIATIIGISAMAVSVIAIAISVILK